MITQPRKHPNKHKESVEKVSKWSIVCCLATVWEVPIQAEFPTHPKLLWGKGLPTWTNEDIFHRQHGCNGKQHIFTIKRSSFYDSTGQVGREGKLHQEFTQSRHAASPYPRKKIQTPDSTEVGLNVNQNVQVQCQPPNMDKEQERQKVSPSFRLPMPTSGQAKLPF